MSGHEILLSCRLQLPLLWWMRPVPLFQRTDGLEGLSRPLGRRSMVLSGYLFVWAQKIQALHLTLSSDYYFFVAFF